MSLGPLVLAGPGNPWCDATVLRPSVLPMDATTATQATGSPYLPWSPPLRLGLARFAADCLMLAAQLDRELEPLHRLGEELLARLAATPTSSARMV